MAVYCSFGLEIKTLFYTRVTLTALFIFIAIPITLLNALVLITVWKTPTLHKPSQILLANLALTDLLAGVITCPYVAYAHLAIVNEWYTSFCVSWVTVAPFAFFLGLESLYTLAIISIDRFLAIKCKFSYSTIVSTRRLFYVLTPGWVINGSLYIVGVMVLEKLPRVVALSFVALYIAIFLSIIACSYSMAFYHLKKLSAQVSSGEDNNSTANPSPNFHVDKYRRSLHTMVIVLFATFIFYLPYFVFVILKNELKELAITSSLLRVAELWTISNSCANPLLYLWRMKDLRQAVKGTVRKCLRR